MGAVRAGVDEAMGLNADSLQLLRRRLREIRVVGVLAFLERLWKRPRDVGVYQSGLDEVALEERNHPGSRAGRHRAAVLGLSRGGASQAPPPVPSQPDTFPLDCPQEPGGLPHGIGEDGAGDGAYMALPGFPLGRTPTIKSSSSWPPRAGLSRW